MRTMQFAGYSGAGKTTLLAKVLAILKARGERVIVLKHHGHGGAPKDHPPFLERKAQVLSTPDAQAPDSFIFLEHGASKVILVSGQMCYVYAHAPSPAPHASPLSPVGRFPHCLGTVDMRPYDWFLIEGFKDVPWPKFFLVRDVSDLQWFERMPSIWSNVKAILFPDQFRLEEAMRIWQNTTFWGVPFVRRDDLGHIVSIMMRTGGVYLDPRSLGHF